MQPKLISLVVFTAAMVVQLMAQVYDWPTLSMVSKPVLMPALMAYFFFSVTKQDKVAFYVVMALFFSWLGDVFLMFQEIYSIYFIIGLASFLIAHVLYVVIFRRTNDNFKPRAFTFATGFLLIIYGILLVFLLWPGLGEMKIPVVLYTGVILAMALSALFRQAEGSSLVLVGAILFVSSDSLLALNKFSESFTGARFWIMATYILAQFLITAGMINYFNRKEPVSD